MRPRIRLRPLAACLLALLAGCGTPSPKPPAIWHAPDTEAALQSLLCRLDADCRWLRLRLYDSDAPRAEIRYRFEIVLSRGMLERTADEAERAFLLAHELAHLHLRHETPRSAAERLPQEVAADAWAARRVIEAGWAPGAGLSLLERLRDELENAGPPHAAAALAEYAARISALSGAPAG